MLSLMWNDQVFQETATFLTDETGLLAFRFYSETNFTLTRECCQERRDSLMFTVGSSYVITPSCPVKSSV